ncbi:MAG: tRNA (N(6)-L-threonylcarbamoyladenosine(37)-C(2))-methylthiotransferase MtaB, partial [Dehalococcoidia bacterium]|nr:tRNA (N(6)-L-threonylcarbamoyladenosine(37)-C(2))-methylthiotransferase MtaB [Dehalococcoidia bacterium]
MVKEDKYIPRIAIYTLGCKLNQSESGEISSDLKEKGFYMVEPGGGFDVLIINTCTVTHVADRKARRLISSARGHNPGAVIIATGCLAERSPEDIKTKGGVDLVLGNEEKGKIPDIIENLIGAGNLLHTGRTATICPEKKHTRALVKIQIGCSQTCTYCIVPSVRRNVHSVRPDDVIKRIKDLEAQGHKEIVLTGSNIGSYNYEHTDLVTLIEGILENTSVQRLRLTSLQPQEITDELLNLWRKPRVCSHLHIPLQSGHDSVLSRMKRRYTADKYIAAVQKARQAVPDLSVTTDVIVGFPGETEDEFNGTIELCRKMGFSRTHVFPFSQRPGTAAALMTGQIGNDLKKER